jgi:hypothetical protein
MKNNMTKSEIEDMVRAYAKKAVYNSKITEAEVKDKINTAVIAICLLSANSKSQGKEFRFGQDGRYTTIINTMKSEIKAVILKRSGVQKSISSKLNKKLGLDPEDWDDQEWINSIRFEKSFPQRLSTYTSRLKFELEAFVAVGMISGRTPAQISEWFMTNIESPHTNIEILNAFDYAAVRTSGILKVGIGGITSAYKSIVRLDEDIMMSSYHISNRTSWAAIKIRKYVQTMQDNLVCSRCQANIGLTFPADEYVVPTHNRCRCFEVPILVTEI